MLQSVDVLPSARVALRRAVEVECEVVSDSFEEPVMHRAKDLSTHGAFLESSLLLEEGAELILSFRPARYPLPTPMTVVGRVVRVSVPRRAGDAGRPGMGVRFVELDYDELLALEHALRGVPPPIPKQLPPKELITVVEEEDEDDDLRFEISTLGELLTAGTAPNFPR